ncbi:hypothetical protein DL98DRAFT_599576 [Cadophora sp. DSE1049]|nr:hypothetical protein DL98DRAFT_599576 [Cadophora sp. DSE1049]
MVGEGDRLDNWDYINDTRRWRDMGSKLWITDSDVYERGSDESYILLGSYCLSTGRSLSMVCSDGVLLATSSLKTIVTEHSGIVSNEVLSNRSKLRLSHAKRVPTPTLNSTYPLKRTNADQEQCELFLREVLDTYGPRDGDDGEHGDGGSVVRVNTDSEKSCIDFKVASRLTTPV